MGKLFTYLEDMFGGVVRMSLHREKPHSVHSRRRCVSPVWFWYMLCKGTPLDGWWCQVGDDYDLLRYKYINPLTLTLSHTHSHTPTVTLTHYINIYKHTNYINILQDEINNFLPRPQEALWKPLDCTHTSSPQKRHLYIECVKWWLDSHWQMVQI